MVIKTNFHAATVHSRPKLEPLGKPEFSDSESLIFHLDSSTSDSDPIISHSEPSTSEPHSEHSTASTSTGFSVDLLPEEQFSSSSSEGLPPASLRNQQPSRISKIIQRILNGKSNRSEQARRTQENFRKRYNSYYEKIEKDSPAEGSSLKKNTKDAAVHPSYYHEGMQLLGRKVFAPLDRGESFVSKRDFIKDPRAYFSKSELGKLRDLQAYLLDRILRAPHLLQEYDWWALPFLLCVTPSGTNRAALLDVANTFREVLAKNQPLHSLRYDLKLADQASSNSSHPLKKDYNDPYYKSPWEVACDQNLFAPLLDTIAKLKENQGDLLSLLRKWNSLPSSTENPNTIDQVNSSQEGTLFQKEPIPLEKPTGPQPTALRKAIPVKPIQRKYQKELQATSDYRQQLETMRDTLFKDASSAFGNLVMQAPQ